MKITSFLMGLGAGVAIAMLTTPRTGDETRELLSEKARQARRYAERRASDLRDMANEATAIGKGVVNRQKNAVSAAVEAAKDAYNRELQSHPA